MAQQDTCIYFRFSHVICGVRLAMLVPSFHGNDVPMCRPTKIMFFFHQRANIAKKKNQCGITDRITDWKHVGFRFGDLRQRAHTYAKTFFSR